MHEDLSKRGLRAMERLRDGLSAAVPLTGVFVTLRSTSQDFVEATTGESAYVLAFTLRHLAGVPQMAEIADRLAQRLMGEMSAEGTWNYWLRASAALETMPYPDDLDTTTLALSALSRHTPAFFSGERLAAYVKILAQHAMSPEGPYGLWIVDHEGTVAAADVDPVVNARILSLLSLENIVPTALSSYVEHALLEDKAQSPFYLGRVPFLFSAAPAFADDQRKVFEEESLLRLETVTSPLDLAHLAEVFLEIRASDEVLERVYEKLIQTVENDSAFTLVPLSVERMHEEEALYIGSKPATMAAVLGALHRVEAECERRSLHVPDARTLLLQSHIRRHARERFAALDPALVKAAEGCITKLFLSDKRGEKTLFPYFVATALGRDEELTIEFVTSVCLAHALGWIAYTVYDDVIDGEAHVSEIPVANVALRSITEIFSSHLSQHELTRALDRVDSANAWEIAHCRLKMHNGNFALPATLPDFGAGEKLVDRSWGMVIPARIIFSALGYAGDGAVVRAFEQYLEHMILANRLMSDVRDWQEDLRRGQLTFVNTDVVRRLLARPQFRYRDDWMDAYALDLQCMYWQETVEQVVALIFSHIEEAGEACEGMPEVSRPFWRSLVAHTAGDARKTLKERERSLAFLTALKR